MPGTDKRPTKWKPKYPIPGQSQPGASWDPDGHWDVDDGKGGRTRWLPNGGGQVDHDNKPVVPSAAKQIGVGAGVGGTLVIVARLLGRAAAACVESGVCEAL